MHYTWISPTMLCHWHARCWHVNSLTDQFVNQHSLAAIFHPIMCVVDIYQPASRNPYHLRNVTQWICILLMPHIIRLYHMYWIEKAYYYRQSSMVCLCICVLVATVSPAKTDQVTEMLLRGVMYGSRKPCIRRDAHWCHLANTFEWYVHGSKWSYVKLLWPPITDINT